MKKTWNIITERPNQKTSDLLEECKSLFPVWTYKDFKDFDDDFPPPKKTTTRTFAPNVEADEKHKNKSANDLEKEGIASITLREQLIMEIQYFKETGKHLDIDNITLCPGSRCRDGGVPGVCFDGFYGKVRVYWCDPDVASGFLRSREVVSLESSENLGKRVEKLESDMDKIKKFLII